MIRISRSRAEGWAEPSSDSPEDKYAGEGGDNLSGSDVELSGVDEEEGEEEEEEERAADVSRLNVDSEYTQLLRQLRQAQDELLTVQARKATTTMTVPPGGSSKVGSGEAATTIGDESAQATLKQVRGWGRGSC